jgi:TetR/AcrR family transcriptional regulator, regulator of biofilm formation and stress response
MTPGQRTQRPSAEQRRDALLKAAMDIAGHSGAGAATHRAIAAKAKVPLATTSYFFSSITELLEEATRRFTADRASELDVVASRLTERATPHQIAERFADLLLDAERTSALAQIEAYLSAARTAGLRDVVATALSAYERVAVAALRAAGSGRAEEGARAFVALADGFAIEHLACPRAEDKQVLRDALRCLFIAYTMDDDERSAWDARLAAQPALPAVPAPPQ